MTSDGVDGTAVDSRPETRPGIRPSTPPLIKPDDGWLAARYIGPAYPHTPATVTPQGRRRERQVASALRNSTNFVTVSLTYGADGTARSACAGLRLRPAATVAAPGQPVQRPPRRSAKGSR
jgi:hypothetical protein